VEAAEHDVRPSRGNPIVSYRDGGWQRSYFEPMKEHFSRAR
jgi:hypothetical protein